MHQKINRFKMECDDYSRRKFIHKSLGMAGALLVATLFLDGCGSNKSGKKIKNKKQSDSVDPCSDLSGVSDQELDKRRRFGYTTKSPVPGSFCGNCALYIPAAAENDCGGCLLFKGPVYAEGHCAQYAVKTQ